MNIVFVKISLRPNVPKIRSLFPKYNENIVVPVLHRGVGVGGCDCEDITGFRLENIHHVYSSLILQSLYTYFCVNIS